MNNLIIDISWKYACFGALKRHFRVTHFNTNKQHNCSSVVSFKLFSTCRFTTAVSLQPVSVQRISHSSIPHSLQWPLAYLQRYSSLASFLIDFSSQWNCNFTLNRILFFVLLFWKRHHWHFHFYSEIFSPRPFFNKSTLPERGQRVSQSQNAELFMWPVCLVFINWAQKHLTHLTARLCALLIWLLNMFLSLSDNLCLFTRI